MTKNYAHLFALNEQDVVDDMIRVNHAGEYGAKRIYTGQLRVLKGDDVIYEMYESELDHLEYFENEMKLRQVRPTVFMPIWNIYGFLLGFLSAACGRETAMLATEAIENVIEKHYGEQIEILNEIESEDILRARIEKFRLEEMEHASIGYKNGKKSIFIHVLIEFCTKIAIKISKTL